ncbi:MAG: tetratricopeptide repeat protein [Chitinispirillaceae bacterium]|nr:tetratricopeptide repeat protein [Chitinispirillaceae bacterium]
MNCRKFRKNSYFFFNADSDQSISRDFSGHLDRCPECRTDNQRQKKLVQLLQSVPVPPVSDDEWQQIHDNVLASVQVLPKQKNLVPFPISTASVFTGSAARAVAALVLCTVTVLGIVMLYRSKAAPAYPTIQTAADQQSGTSGDALAAVLNTSTSPKKRILYPGNTVSTDAASSLRISLDKKSTIHLEKNSRLKVTQFTREKSVYSLEQGQLAASISKRKPGQLLRIETPNAFCEVIGTRFNVTTDHDTYLKRHITTLTVEEGTVRFGTAEKSIAVRAGNAIALIGDSLGTIFTSDDPEFRHLLEKTGEGPLNVVSTPPGARLFIDGNETGRTPYSGLQPFGNHTVSCIMEGYTPWNDTCTIAGHSGLQLEIHLSSTTGSPEIPADRKTVEPQGKYSSLLATAHGLLLDGKYKEALRLLAPVAENGKVPPVERAAAISKMSLCYRHSGDYTTAAEMLTRIIDGDFPDAQRSNALFERASIYMNNLKKTEYALADYHRYTKQYGDGIWSNEATYSIAELAFGKGAYDEARNAYQRLCESPRQSNAIYEKSLYSLGFIYANYLSDYSRAINLFNRLQLEFPDSRFLEDALFWSAECCMRDGFPDRAITGYGTYQKRFPNGKWKAEVGKRLKQIETAGVR